MRGSGCATAASAESNAWSGSYTTLMRSRAAVAVSSVVAATAATGSPMKRTLSGHSACSSWETGRMPKGIGKSRPVSTACTPSRRVAAETSIETIRAWACELRSSLQYSIRGKARSSANFVVPVTFATASTLRCAFPIMADGRTGEQAVWSGAFSVRPSARPPVRLLPAPIQRLFSRPGILTPQAGRRELYRLVDLDVAGAAAEVAGQGVLDLFARRVGVFGQQGLGGEEERRRAVAALGGAQVGEGFLQRVQPAAQRHPFDGLHRVVRAGETEDQARQHGRAIEQHGARAAFTELASVLGAREPQVFAQYFEQRLVGRKGHLGGLAIDLERDSDHGPNVILI